MSKITRIIVLIISIIIFLSQSSISQTLGECEKGKYGVKCNETCNCNKVDEKTGEKIIGPCAKYTGYCLNCGFGNYGKSCNSICTYKCFNSSACCMFKGEKKYKDNQIQLSLDDLNILNVIVPKQSTKQTNINIANNDDDDTIDSNDDSDQIQLNLGIDYSSNLPLTIISQDAEIYNCPNIERSVINSTFLGNKSIGDYNKTFQSGKIELKGELFNIKDVILQNASSKKDKTIRMDGNVVLANEISCNGYKAPDKIIQGFVGLGKYNTLAENLFTQGKIKANTISFKLKDGEKKINIILGNYNSDSIDNFNRYASCKSINNDELLCEGRGIKFSNDKAFKFDGNVKFSLTDDTAFYLKKDQFLNVIKNRYFADDYSSCTFKENKMKIFCKKIEKNSLQNFGIVVNDHVFYFKQNEMFDNSEITDDKFKVPFKVTFGDENRIIIGKDYLKDKYFVINSEDGYFYTYINNYYEYFDVNSTLSTNYHIKKNPLNPFKISMIVVACILFANILVFAIYYPIKKYQIKHRAYNKVELDW